MNETIKIENGKNIIGIFFDGHVECLKIKKTISADWYDNEGTMGKYFILNSDFEKIDTIHDFNKSLIESDLNSLKRNLNSFLHLFFNGEYHINITSWKVEYSEIHKDYSKYGDSKIYDYHFLNHNNCNFMFTQTAQLISMAQVEHYKKMISNGVKPKIIILGNYNTPNPAYYILDGHHKFLAYLSLNQPCEFITIMKISKEEKVYTNYLFNDYESILSEPLKENIMSNHPLFKK